jgi:hypothetical protein
LPDLRAALEDLITKIENTLTAGSAESKPAGKSRSTSKDDVAASLSDTLED